MKVKTSVARKFLSNLSPEELKKRNYKKCSRCGGTGNHSYNPIHGSTCFKCNGLGFIKINFSE